MEIESKQGDMVQMAFPRQILIGILVMKDLDRLILMIGLGQPTAVDQITVTVVAEDQLYQVIQEFQSKKIKQT